MTTTAMQAAVVAVGVLTVLIGVIELWIALARRISARRSTFDTSDS